MYKIAMISQNWSDDYFKNLVAGFNDSIKDIDIRVDIFNAYDVQYDDDIAFHEAKIFTLPDPDIYDGLLISSIGSMPSASFKDTIDKFYIAKKPIITIDRHVEKTVYVGIDNYASEYLIMEHMINEHGCKTFQFVGGREDVEDNVQRFHAFLDCLEKHNLKANTKYIKHYRFFHDDGRKAYHDIVDNGLPLPDCVICANDLMALGYMKEAIADGHNIPEAFRISGFDNIYDAQHFFPSLTTIDRDIRKLGFVAMNLILDNIKNGTPIKDTLVPGHLVAGESCGCGLDRNPYKEYQTEIELRYLRDSIDSKHKVARDWLCTCKSFANFTKALGVAHNRLDLFDTIVCLEDDFTVDSNNIAFEYPRYFNVYYETGEGTVDRKESIFPDMWKDRKEKIFIFSPVYFALKSFGYCVAPYVEEKHSRHFHSQYIDTLSITLENIRQKLIIDSINQKFKDLYVIDQLTGLYNRFGYNAMAGKLFLKEKGRIYIVYIDIDNLKIMNDNFGHDVGDLAIRGTADCIKKVFTDTDIRVRMGGDEFLIMGAFTSEEDLAKKEQELVEALNSYSDKFNFPIPLTASIGHSFNINQPEATELEKLLKSADQNMDKVKIEHKKDSNRNSVAESEQ